RGTQLVTGVLGARRRLGRARVFPKHVPNRELVQYVMQKNRDTVPPVIVRTGPVKENILRRGEIDQTEFPVPKWHFKEGGRYIHTFSAMVTRDPDTRAMNAGIYRGMIGSKDPTPMLLIRGRQHRGQHCVKYSERGPPTP